MNAQSKPISGVIRLAQLLLFTAVVLSTYLAYQAFTGSQVAGCGPEEGCGKVLSSKWSSVLSIPVSLPGLITYLTLLLVTQFLGLRQKIGSFLASFLSLSILLGALWFTALQMYVIKSYCAYCCTTHGIASLGALIILMVVFSSNKVKKVKKVAEVTVPKRNTGSKKQREKLAKLQAKLERKQGVQAPDTSELSQAPSDKATPVGFALPALLSLLVLGAVIGLQAMGPEKDRSEVVSAPDADENKKQIPIKDRVLITPFKFTPNSPSQIAYAGGAIFVGRDEVEKIVIGNSAEDAEVIHLTYLFDWACDHCRGLHQRLSEISLQNNPLSLEEKFEISLLPGFYDAKSEAIHRIMLTLSSKDPALYKEIELGLYDGSIEASAASIMAQITQKIPATTWQPTVTQYKTRVDRVIEIAKMQVAHNEERVDLSIFPQLTSLSSVISGVPTDNGLEKFFKNAAQEQKEFLALSDTGINRPLALPYKNSKTVTKPAVKEPERNNSVIEFISKEVDGEPIQPGEVSKGTFTFKNTGTDPLTIYNLKTGCGCTYSEGWKQTVEPGGTGEFTVNYNSKGKTPYGVHTRSIWVTSSAKNHDNSSSGKLYGNQVKMMVPMVDSAGNPVVRATKDVNKPNITTINKPTTETIPADKATSQPNASSPLKQ